MTLNRALTPVPIPKVARNYLQKRDIFYNFFYVLIKYFFHWAILKIKGNFPTYYDKYNPLFKQ